MPRLLIFSDLHLEMVTARPMPRDFDAFDAAIVAGDLTQHPAVSMSLLADNPGLDGRPVLFVPGNHEFYHSSLAINLSETKDDANVQLLHRRTVVHQGVRFIGAILWTDYELDGIPMREQHLTDQRVIFINERGHFLLPAHARDLHRADLAYIREQLAISFDGPTVVVTHHAPHRGSIAMKFVGSRANGAFASDLSSTIEEFRPALWVHGHTHSFCDYLVGGTRIICNPRGYAQENPTFHANLVVEV